jgi:hypothetical protein
MKKYISFMIVVSLLSFCFSSCSGYNGIMRNHLSDPENYRTYEAVLVDMCYVNPNTGEQSRDFENDDFLDCDVILFVNFETVENVAKFLGGQPNPDMPLDEFKFALEITAENSKILYENGFYTDVVVGDQIRVRSSDWIYMDGDFFYIAQLEYKDTVYLSFDDGLKNMIEIINKNKSLF